MKPKIYKTDGKPQRFDTALTKEIANALMRRVLSGQSLFPKGGELTLSLQDREGEKTLTISCGTLNTWITRGNVIPETGEVLREFLDKARAEHRIKERERRQQDMVELAEKRAHRLLKLRTNQPVAGMFGVIRDENGNLVRKENVPLLREQMREAQFVRERLDPQRYGRVEKGEHKHLVFSLSDLRKAKEEMNRANSA